jgi:hypothetical protein
VRRALSLVIGAVLIALGTFAMVAGSVMVSVIGTDGLAQAPSVRAVTPTTAFVIDPARLDAGLPSAVSFGRGRIDAVSLDESATFVGAGPADDVLAYLAGAPYEVAQGVDGRSAALDALVVAGDGAPSPPVAQSLWTAQSSGPGAQGIEVPVSGGQQLVVVMRADGQGPVDVRLDAQVEVEGAGAIAVAAIAAGIALVLAGILLLSRRDRDRPSGEAGTPDPAIDEPSGATNVAVRAWPIEDGTTTDRGPTSPNAAPPSPPAPGWGAPVAPSDTAVLPRPRTSIDVRRPASGTGAAGPDAPPREAVPTGR